MTTLSQEELLLRAQRLPWKVVVRMLKTVVEEQRSPREMPQVVLEWLDFNRQAGGTSREEVTAWQQRFSQAFPSADIDLGDDERAPIGPWWIGMQQYLREGRCWWLLRAFRADGADVLQGSSRSDTRRLHKVVDYAGGDAARPLIEAGETLFWSWRT